MVSTYLKTVLYFTLPHVKRLYSSRGDVSARKGLIVKAKIREASGLRFTLIGTDDFLIEKLRKTN